MAEPADLDKPPIETWQTACNRRMEVARVPAPVVRTVERRLRALAMYLDDLLEPDDLQRVFSMVAGVAHQVSVGAKTEVLETVRRRALKTKLKATEDDAEDLVAAAELEDLAEDLHQEILMDTGKL